MCLILFFFSSQEERVCWGRLMVNTSNYRVCFRVASCAQRGVYLCVCVRPLSSLVKLRVRAMSERVRLAPTCDPVANAASRYAEMSSY